MVKNFTKSDISNKIFKGIGFSKNFSSNIVDNFFKIFSHELIKNKKVTISSFGSFLVMEKKARIGRNPKTKVEVEILPRKVIKFKPSLLFKKKINK